MAVTVGIGVAVGGAGVALHPAAIQPTRKRKRNIGETNLNIVMTAYLSLYLFYFGTRPSREQREVIDFNSEPRLYNG